MKLELLETDFIKIRATLYVLRPRLSPISEMGYEGITNLVRTWFKLANSSITIPEDLRGLYFGIYESGRLGLILAHINWQVNHDISKGVITAKERQEKYALELLKSINASLFMRTVTRIEDCHLN